MEFEEIINDKEEREFYWDVGLKRYRYKDSGRLAPKKAILNLTKRRITDNQKDLENITEMLYDGDLRLEDWQRTAAKRLKTVHLESLLLGRGGLENVTDDDYLVIGRTLRSEYGYLRNFAREIKAGTVSREQAIARIKMYSRKSNRSYWYGQQKAHGNAKYMKRILAPVEHCADCKIYANMGIQPVGTLPLPTESCACGSNCRCSVIYYDEMPKNDSFEDAFVRFKNVINWVG